MVRALVCGTRGRWFESTLLYQIMTKEKKNKPSKELPLGFVDRQEKELLIRDFIISNIKEIMVKYGFQYIETPSFEYSDSIGKFLPDKDRPDEGVFSFKDENKWLSLRIQGYLRLSPFCVLLTPTMYPYCEFMVHLSCDTSILRSSKQLWSLLQYTNTLN